MPKKVRRDCAQINLRMEPAERDRIQAAIPYGSLNSTAIQLLMDYARQLEANNARPHPPLEDPAA